MTVKKEKICKDSLDWVEMALEFYKQNSGDVPGYWVVEDVHYKCQWLEAKVKEMLETIASAEPK